MAKALTRRELLKAATVLGLGGALATAVALPRRVEADVPPDLQFFKAVRDPESPTPLEKEHLIQIRAPRIAEDGANVPVIVLLPNHPMEPDHYIKSLHVLNFKDPLVTKGVYNLTPANGQAYISIQIRMDSGDTELFVIAHCTKHGPWVASRKLKVTVGGC